MFTDPPEQTDAMAPGSRRDADQSAGQLRSHLNHSPKSSLNMNTTEAVATQRHQIKTREEMRAMSCNELDEERALILQGVAAIRGQLAAQKMMAECGARKIDDEWVVRAFTSAERMAETARWITDQIASKKPAEEKAAKSNPAPKQSSEQKKAKAIELAELSLRISTEKRLNAEAALEMQERAKAAKKERAAEQEARQQRFERAFVDSAKEMMPADDFARLRCAAEAMTGAAQGETA